MSDFLTPSQRSALMSRIRGKNTRIEKLMFARLRKLRIKFTRHHNRLRGRPDILIPEERLLIFLDGDFWHGRNYHLWQHKLTALWRAKIGDNIRRDHRQRTASRRRGWHVMRLWGSDILKDDEKCARRILALLARIRAEKLDKQ